MEKKLIYINDCNIEKNNNVVLKNINFEYKKNQAILITGPNGGGKAEFIKGLCNINKICVNTNNLESSYFNIFEKDTQIVSLEVAAKLIEEERNNDESEYIEGGVDIGRTGRFFLAQSLYPKLKKDETLPEEFKDLENNYFVRLCGIEKILDRGLKYMSTGEIRRTLLCRALISKKKLLILSDPFAGLDVKSREILLNFFNLCIKNNLDKESFEKIKIRENRGENFDESETRDGKEIYGGKEVYDGKEIYVGNEALDGNKKQDFPNIILSAERFTEIPESITTVIEFRDNKISFYDTKEEYQKYLTSKEELEKNQKEEELHKFNQSVNLIQQETKNLQIQHEKNINSENSDNREKCKNNKNDRGEKFLIEMNNVNVSWSDNHVLRDLSWKLKKGEHWLIRGPNGCGKTTFLELITGDNMQVFCNDIKIFGARRGSGETIWDIKKRLGIVSYRLHVEYRMVGSCTLENVIISGFKDSIGLYEVPTDLELDAAKKWLSLAGFEGREKESFNSLSYGQQRAILILRAAVKNPEILILDEPCHGLDENYREKILSLLEIIAKSNTTTMLHVTHDVTEVRDFEKHILEFTPENSPMYKILCR